MLTLERFLNKFIIFVIFLNTQVDLFILKTDVKKFTSTNKKTLHLIFKTKKLLINTVCAVTSGVKPLSLLSILKKILYLLLTLHRLTKFFLTMTSIYHELKVAQTNTTTGATWCLCDQQTTNCNVTFVAISALCILQLQHAHYHTSIRAIEVVMAAYSMQCTVQQSDTVLCQRTKHLKRHDDPAKERSNSKEVNSNLQEM